MGKGNRNRINRDAEPKKVQQPKKARRYRKPLSGTAKTIIASAVCVVLVVAIVLSILLSNGVFKRANIMIKSRTGEFDVNQQMATYLVWDALFSSAYYQWTYYSSTIQQTYGSNMDQSTWCLQNAASGVQDTLKTGMTSCESTLKQYVAVCDIAQSAYGISLTKEEKKAAREEAKAQIEAMAVSNQTTASGFINLYIGNNVKMKDIQDAAVLQTLYYKIYEKKLAEVEDSVTDEILNKYRDDNPESFYSTDYLLYTTTDAAMKDQLLAATTANAFKTILLKDMFDNGDNTYKYYFNKDLTNKTRELDTIWAAIKGQTSLEALTTKLGEQGMTAQEYVKEGSTLPTEVTDWMFDTAKRAAFDTTTITTAEDAYYVIALTTKPAEGKVNAAIKEIALDEGESYKNKEENPTIDDASFKTNFYNTLLNELELLDSTEGLTIYNDTDDTKVQTMLDNMVKAFNTKLPTKTEAYTKPPVEGKEYAKEYQEWMFKNESAPLTSPVAAGAVKEYSETKDNTTTYRIYCIVDPMKLDQTPLVDGGYLEFTGTNHATDAKAFLDTLSGLGHDELAKKFTDNSKAVVSELLAKSSVSDTNLSDWLFADDRKEHDTALITATAANKSYVAFFDGSTPTWENTADNGYVSETFQNWLDELAKDYTLDGLNRIKDQNPVETEASTTAAVA